jgi:hypothetical protein
VKEKKQGQTAGNKEISVQNNQSFVSKGSPDKKEPIGKNGNA